jgi:hypothetical protein
MSRIISCFLCALAIISYVQASFDIALQCPYPSDVDSASLEACVSTALTAQLGAINVHIEDRRQRNLEGEQDERELTDLCVYYKCSTSQANEYWCDRLNCPGWRRQLSEVAISSTTLLNVELDLEDCITAAGGTYAGPCTADLSISA